MSEARAEIRESLSPLKQAFLALEEAEQRIRQLEEKASEPIAIVGMGCRFPGAEGGPEGYWGLLRNRECAVRDGVEARLGLSLEKEHVPHEARWAGLLERVDLFDPRHFGIAPREAGSMDPQQRLLLEVSWEALEDAGIDPFSLYQTQTGVYVGIASHDYAQLAMRHHRLDQIDQYFAAGGGASVAAGRISYVLGLNGPALSVDTACSSSLVAVHLACEALQSGACTTALACGVNLILSPEACAAFAQAGMLSRRGVCAAFDREADGFVRGEGCGVVVLKRLRDAEADGDRIAAVIRGSAVNQDGASSGLTVPNGLAQQALLREAHRRAGVEAGQIGYVEAHGTGTRLGDPIEAEALGTVFAGRGQKLAIGSVKANLGHLEAAAGVAGLIRVVLSLEHGEIPGQVHWSRPSEHVRWEELPLEVVTEARRWEAVEGRRIGGVSSFGFSGTNAHVVVEGRSREAAEAGEERPDVLVISARTEAALGEMAGRYAEYLEEEEEWRWAEICATAGVGRAEMSERLAVMAEGKREAAGKLRAWLQGESVLGIYAGHVGAGQRGVRESDGLAGPEQMAEAWVRGGKVDWAARHEGRRLRRAQLPTYAFQRERYWIEERKGTETAGEPARGALLGRRLQVAGVRAQYEALLKSDGWIGEHEVEGEAVLPGTGHMELMLEAGAETLAGGCVLEDVELEARLAIAGERRVQTVVEEEQGGRSRVRLYAERESEWERVSEGWLRRAEQVEVEGEGEDLESVRTRLRESAAGDRFYAEMADRGMVFGERFRGVERLWVGEGEALGEIALRARDGAGWQITPWWLDACLQVVGAAAGGEGLYLPVRAERVEVMGRPGDRSWSHVCARWVDARTLVADVAVFHPDGAPLARVAGLRFRTVEAQRPRIDSLLYRMQWRPADGASVSIAKSMRILVLGNSEQAVRLTAHLRQRGISVRHSAVEGWIEEPDGEEHDCVVWVADPERNLSSLAGAPVVEMESPIRSLLSTAQRLAGQRSSARLYVVTTKLCAVTQEQSNVNLAHAPLSGMAAAVAAESPESRCTHLDIEDANSDVAGVAAELLSGAEDHWVAWRSGRRYTGKLERLRVHQPNPEERSPVRLETHGGIDALRWGAASRRALEPDEVEIRVHATALNFHDVLQVLGVIPDEGPPGTDCAGMVVRTGDAVTDLAPGDAVVGIAPGCFATHAIARRSLMVRKPPALSFADAAGQTVAYLTAAWCLEEIARVRAGETVLIHAAAGGVGLAAVHLCQRIGAKVIATAGSEAKREFLRRLGVERVYDSRSVEFASHIQDGVDVVLNSLAGAAIDRALALLREGGRFVELGRTDIRDPRSVASAWPKVRYVPVDLTPLFAEGSPWVRKRMTTLFGELESGQLACLPVTAFASAQVKDAFRYMARAAHIGRVVVESGEDFSGAHIVTGGMRGVGLAVAEWLAVAGAQALILVGRNAPNAEAQQAMERLRDAGKTVDIVRGDIADPATAREAVERAGGNLRGIWHAASVLENLALADQTWDSMLRVLRPKAEGAWNLHVAAAGRRLKYFVLFSSWASIGGSHGQVNYCAANSFLDALAAFRYAQGLPALSVNWGAWQGLGMTAAGDVQQRLARAGMESMTPEEALDGLRSVLGEGCAQAGVARLNWPRYLAQNAERRRDPFYADFAPTQSRETEERKLPAASVGSRRGPAAATSEADLLRIVGDTVRRTLAFHEGEAIDPDVPLSDLGMDSLLAVDLRNSLANALERQLPSTLLFDYPTVSALMAYLKAGTGQEEEATWQAVPAQEPAAQSRDSFAFLSAIEAMSDEQVEDMIGKHSRV